jgi:hypothetical protein
MKNFFFVLISLCVYLAPTPSVEASERDATALMQTLFIALQEGDTGGIMDLCTDPLLAQKRDLLENNHTYSKFLRQTYGNASMIVKKIEMLDDFEGFIDVEFHFPIESLPLKTRYLIKNQAGVWRIASEETIDHSSDR